MKQNLIVGALLLLVAAFAIPIYFVEVNRAPLELFATAPEVVHERSIPMTAHASGGNLFVSVGLNGSSGFPMPFPDSGRVNVSADGVYHVTVSAVRQPFAGIGELFGIKPEEVTQRFIVRVDATAPAVQIVTTTANPALQVMEVVGIAQDASGIKSVTSVGGSTAEVAEDGSFRLSISYDAINSVFAWEEVPVRVTDRSGFQISEWVPVEWPASRIVVFKMGNIQKAVITQPGFVPNGFTAALMGKTYRVYSDGQVVNTVGFGFPLWTLIPVLMLAAGGWYVYRTYPTKVRYYWNTLLVQLGRRKPNQQTALTVPETTKALMATTIDGALAFAQQTKDFAALAALSKLIDINGYPASYGRFAIFCQRLSKDEAALIANLFEKINVTHQTEEVTHA